ncbi:MAG TPA: hypothetical protein VIM14_00180, partial [Polyangia bacterium]
MTIGEAEVAGLDQMAGGMFGGGDGATGAAGTGHSTVTLAGATGATLCQVGGERSGTRSDGSARKASFLARFEARAGDGVAGVAATSAFVTGLGASCKGGSSAKAGSAGETPSELAVVSSATAVG